MDPKQGAATRPPHRSLALPSDQARHVRFGSGRIPSGLPAESMDRDDVRIQSALLSMRQHKTLRQRANAVIFWTIWGGAVSACLAIIFSGGQQ